MHIVAILLPIEAIITLYSWTMFFYDREAMLSPEARAAGFPICVLYWLLRRLAMLSLMMW